MYEICDMKYDNKRVIKKLFVLNIRIIGWNCIMIYEGMYILKLNCEFV